MKAVLRVFALVFMIGCAEPPPYKLAEVRYPDGHTPVSTAAECDGRSRLTDVCQAADTAWYAALKAELDADREATVKKPSQYAKEIAKQNAQFDRAVAKERAKKEALANAPILESIRQADAYRSHIESVRRKSQAMLNEHPRTPEEAVDLAARLLTHRESYENGLISGNQDPVCVEMLSNEIHAAVGQLFLAGGLYTNAKQPAKARVVYQNIIRTFSGLVYSGYRDRAKMELDILNR